MGKLVKSSKTNGVVPAVASAVLPGLGQLINRDSDKAIGVFVVWGIAGLSVLKIIPLLSTVAAVVGVATWGYAVVDGYLEGKKK